MDKGMRLLAFDLCAGLGVTAFVVWARATFPALAGRMDRLGRSCSAARTFWVGLGVAVILGIVLRVVGPAAAAVPPLGIVVAALLAAAAFTALRGAMALWPDYGHRVLGVDRAPTELQATLAGGALLTGMLLLFPAGPVFLAYVLLRCLGAGVLVWTEPHAAPAATRAPAPPGAATGQSP